VVRYCFIRDLISKRYLSTNNSIIAIMTDNNNPYGFANSRQYLVFNRKRNALILINQIIDRLKSMDFQSSNTFLFYYLFKELVIIEQLKMQYTK
jgi:hypothetical protein